MDSSKMSAADFKARCLAVLDEVAATGTTVIVTKRGKPIARLMPLEPETAVANPLKGSLSFEGDLIAPAPELWGDAR